MESISFTRVSKGSMRKKDEEPVKYGLLPLASAFGGSELSSSQPQCQPKTMLPSQLFVRDAQI